MIQQVIFAQPDCVKSSTSLWVSSKVLDTSDWKDVWICSFNNEAMWFSLESFLLGSKNEWFKFIPYM
jgi:hypothetical protein